jgi:hypothetical protein
MATKSLRPLRIAVDTNVVLDLAAGVGHCLECLGHLHEKTPPPILLITPTAEAELGHLSACGRDLETRRLATMAIANLASWKITSQALTTLEAAIASRISTGLVEKGLLPTLEINDSLIIAEATQLDCDVLISSDGHMRGIDQDELQRQLREAHVKETLIVSPRLISRMI